MMDRLVFGTLSLRELEDREAFALLDAFARASGHWLDTSWFYGCGRVERLIARWSHAHGARPRIATKVGYFPSGQHYRDSRALRDHVLYAIDRLERVPDFVSLHEADWRCWWRDGVAAGELWCDENGVEPGAWEVLTTLATQLGFRAGITGNNAAPLATLTRQLAPQLVLVAKQYDLLWRNARPLFELADAGEVWLASPLHQGWLSRLDELGARRPELQPSVARLEEICAGAGVRASELALPFVIATAPMRTRVVFGADSVAQVEQACGAPAISSELIEDLQRIGVVAAPMPGPILAAA